MPLYLDSCAVVKRYVDEQDGATPTMDRVYADPALWGGLLSSAWLLPEVTASLAKKLRSGELTRRQFTGLMQAFRLETERVVTLSEVGAGYADAASSLLEATPEVRFHSGDALHLYTATAIRMGIGGAVPFVFVTADERLTDLVRSRGLSTFNPATEPIAALDAFFGR
jgi:predicted nucleic acid-binding protein